MKSKQRLQNTIKVIDVLLVKELMTIDECKTLAANNIKRFAFRNINTVGTTEIYACGDMSEDAHSAQEAHESSVRG